MTILILQESINRLSEPNFVHCLTAAKTHSPGSRVVRFGNVPVNCDCDFELEGDYARTAAQLYLKYQGPRWQWRSIKRWPIFLEWCEAEKVTEFFSMDSDVLLFCDVDAQRPIHPAAMSLIKTKNVWSPGVCYIRSLDVLRGFVDWLKWLLDHKDTDTYRLVTYHCGNFGINDMELWTRYLKDFCPTLETGDLTTSSVVYPGSFDANLQTLEDGWASDGAPNASKLIVFERGFPYGTRHGLKERLFCLHCWGIWKTRMQELWARSRASV